MALTVRTNGSGSGNIISAQWFNDFYDLLTGSMNDQPVSLVCTTANALPFSVTGVNDQGHPLVQAANTATSGDNSDILQLVRLTNQPASFMTGINSTGGYYVYDGNNACYALETIAGCGALGTFDGSASTRRTIRVFIGTIDPSTYTTVNEGDLWVKA